MVVTEKVGRFGVDNAKVVSVPLVQHFKFSTTMSPTTIGNTIEMLKFPYAQTVGCLLYSIVCTMLDISYALSVVSKYMTNLGNDH